MRLDSQRVTTPGFVVWLAILGIVAGVSMPLVAEDFDHVHLTAPDMLEAATWYQELFGGKLGKSGPFDAVYYGNDILKVREGEPTSGQRRHLARPHWLLGSRRGGDAGAVRGCGRQGVSAPRAMSRRPASPSASARTPGAPASR